MNVSYQKTRARSPSSPVASAIGALPEAARPLLLQEQSPSLPPAVLALIGASLLVRLVMANAVDPGYDEAYYWSYARHLDWSYFDHPPMVGWLAALGPALTGMVSAWTLRLGAVLLFTGSLVLMYRLVLRIFNPRAAFWSVVVCNFAPIFCVGYGTFLAPDSGLVFFWLLTLLGLARVLFPRGQREAAPLPPNLGTSLCIGLGLGGALLSKYHGIFLAVGILIFLMASPSARFLLRSPAFYAAGLLGGLGFVPVLYWNMQHDFASFAFQGMRALPDSGTYDWHRILGSLGGQMIELTPPVALACWYYLCSDLRRGRLLPGSPRLFLAVFGVLPLVFFTVLAGAAPSFSHWPMPAYLALIPLVGDGISRALVRHRRTAQALVLASMLLIIASASLSYLHARFGILQRAPGTQHVLIPLIPPQSDPSLEMTGWTKLGDFLRARGYAQRPNTFFFSHLYHFCGIISFGLQDQGYVYCFNRGDARAFAFWQDPRVPLGQDGIFICNRRFHVDAVQAYSPYFERVELLEELPLYRNGVEVERFTLFLGRRLIKPFPFTYTRSEPNRSSPAGFRIFRRLPVYL